MRFSNGGNCPSRQKASAEVKLLQCYGLSETASSRFEDQEHVEGKLYLVGGPVQNDCESKTNGKGVEVGQHGNCRTGANVMRAYWNNRKNRSRISKRMFRTGDIGYRIQTAISTPRRLKDLIVQVAKMFIPARSKRSSTTSAVLKSVFGIPDPMGELVMIASC